MKLALVFVAVLLVTSLVVADDGLTLSSSSCSGSNDLLNTLVNLPNCIVDSFFSYIVSGLIASVASFIDASFKFLFSAPDPNWFCTPYGAVMAVLETLYSIALMGLALMFIVRSNDAEGRLAAKKWLENMLALIVLLAFSFPLFQMLLDFNTYLATSFAGTVQRSVFTPNGTFTSAIFAFLMLLIIALLLILTFITLLIRYILIPFLLLLFPIAIFLYFIPWTQSWGKTFLRSIALIVFMTTVDALILLGLSSLFNASDPNLADSLVRAFAVLLGFGAIGLINAFLLISAFTGVITQSKALTGIAGLTMAGRVLKAVSK
ncbi:hypothetical protein AUJ14_05385 [Candidatus Micrarchaeota archaeon CG1_02_55_22]|nr:MAG: hypothetical protein AUJ14_05385 [Candidatus Micrarchaeota archaeon CG1_02_55_22]